MEIKYNVELSTKDALLSEKENMLQNLKAELRGSAIKMEKLEEDKQKCEKIKDEEITR